MTAAPSEPVQLYNFRKRYKPLTLLFLIPIVICALSWARGGDAVFTDAGFVALTIICALLLGVELLQFSGRFGIGGMILFGGTIIWFCQDYMQNVLGQESSFRGFRHVLDHYSVAKAATWYSVFLFMAALGLLIPHGRRSDQLFNLIPTPQNNAFYFYLLLIFFVLGISPFFLFTDQPWYEAVWLEMISGDSGGAEWTTGRTGSQNVAWGGYVAELIRLGRTGGVYAIFYAVLIARNWLLRIPALLIWAFWVALAFGSGTRGQVVYIMFPAILLYFLKYHAYAAAILKKVSIRAYILAAILLAISLVMVHFQGHYRRSGFLNIEMSNLKHIKKLKGNEMFSSSLDGFRIVPEYVKPLYGERILESILRPLPEKAFWMIIAPIPRALWRDKPLDRAWLWYNKVYKGYESRGKGTTIAPGIVGEWYFRYGMSGVIQGGLLFGWLCGLCEHLLRCSRGRPLQILFSLALATWLLRSFRMLDPNTLIPIGIGFLVITIVLYGLGARRVPQPT